MNSRKKQTVAVAMATALGASTMMSPVAVHALEEDPATAVTQESNQQESTQEAKPQDDTPVSEQGLPISEQPQELNTNSLSSGKPIIQPRANGAFTDKDEAAQAIRTALADYPVSNETTQQEIVDFLRKEFVTTGKLVNVRVGLVLKTEATQDATGSIDSEVQYTLINDSTWNVFSYIFTIPRIPKTVAINKANFPDDSFRQYVSDNCDTVKDGVLSLDEISKVTTITIINNSNVKSLEGIEHFTALTRLDCYNTGIQTLDVSNNPSLTYLDCHNTGIQTLDVSNNTALRYLYCNNTPLAYLNLGNLPLLIAIDKPSLSVVDLAVTSDSFDMTQAFQGIDISKVTNIKGAKLNGNDLTGYQLGKPITYTYDCGTVLGNPEILDVTLNLVKSDSDIQITGNLSWHHTVPAPEPVPCFSVTIYCRLFAVQNTSYRMYRPASS